MTAHQEVSVGEPHSVMETVKLAASRLAEAARRHERISSSDYIRNTADPSCARIRSELQAVHKKRRLEKLDAEQRQANNDFSGVDEGLPITQIMREDLIRGTEGDQRLKEWLEKYVYGCGNASPSTSTTTATTDSV
ncbi:hypothetical protein Pmar_PMAR011812 [Perkinsus marinus ATCC 50983]|uniref:Uncharacterized protein n=1 Tax=Perkinsus marinus (strain ATCC 50983 / TXsc) TaxID=423536 RepID=C5LCT2_PERM5|nr:hypothetical protein Pmar_PMAR011812 [Perkinsus marinus ATCC 50983]EER05765.1 hypothetical protein Pmar_PMAR011812 [Perkinsus marinus ATCC 50983]|eukprot:XP_002773949.1 hypothetical protein Pmar_PMAR011812 [Perkinsus marinus ATCC 50983]